MSTLKPIPSKYRGTTFRSRLEARWAIFFDLLELKWLYEPEGYFLGEEGKNDPKLCYLPDFLLRSPQGKDIWIEIKPRNIISSDKFSKFKKMIESDKKESRTKTFLLSGQPSDILETRQICPRCAGFISLDYVEDDYLYCYSCDLETPTGGGHDERKDGLMGFKYTPHKGDLKFDFEEFYLLNQKIDRAAKFAENYDFTNEHLTPILKSHYRIYPDCRRRIRWEYKNDLVALEELDTIDEQIKKREEFGFNNS